MVLFGANDFFVLEKNTGQVKREGLLILALSSLSMEANGTREL